MNVIKRIQKTKHLKRKIITLEIEQIKITHDLSCMHPILEDNTLVCLHGGKVSLKAKNANRMKSDNVPIMLDNEIQGSKITGCCNPQFLGGPCQRVIMLFAYTLTEHKVNKKRAVLQVGLLGASNTIWPIIAIPKKNKFKFSFSKTQAQAFEKAIQLKDVWLGQDTKEGRREAIKDIKKLKQDLMLIYLAMENERDKVSNEDFHLYKYNRIWPKNTPKPRSPDYILEDGEIDWPKNYGYKIPPKPREITLKKGTKLDRYGDNSGSFVCPFEEKKGAISYEKRSLPYEDNEAMQKTYKRYEVIEDINMESVDRKVRMSRNEELIEYIKELKEKNKFHSPKVGKISPHFEQEGGGTQIKLPISIENLIQLGFIKQIP